MVNYKHGKIYRLVNDELGLTYYGSTCNELRKRLNDHKSQAKDKKYTSHKLFESGKCKIYLVEKFPCEDRMELTQRERYYIENNECVNKVIPGRTYKEYYKQNYDNNKEQIAQQRKEHYQNNKEQIKEKMKEYQEANKEQLAKQRKKNYEANKEQIAQQRKEYRQANKEKIAQKAKEYQEANKEELKQKKKEYYLKKKAQQKEVYNFLTQIENSNKFFLIYPDQQ